MTSMARTLFMVICVLSLQQLTVQAEQVSDCFRSTKALKIACPKKHMVRISRSFYGYSASGECKRVPSAEKCTQDDFQNYPCTGHQSCSINLPSGNYGRRIQRCNRTSNYFQVEYECVSAAETHKLCHSKILRDQQGYISTPRYPNNLRGPFTCNLTIQVEPYQKIRLYIIDLDLQDDRDKNACDDLLYMDEGIRSATLCGKRGNEQFMVHHHTLKLTLTVGKTGSRKGLWLHYEAFPALTSTSKTATSTMLLPAIASKKLHIPLWMTKTTQQSLSKTSQISRFHEPITKHSGTKLNNPVVVTTPSMGNSEHYHQKDINNRIPFAAIAGGVIGSLGVVLFILLVLLLIKCMREKRECQKDHFEIRNPAFRTSGDFPNLDCYNY